MALQLFRRRRRRHYGIIGTLFLGIFLFLINGSLSVSANGPDPQIEFIIQPPHRALVSKKYPLLLPCVANHTGPYNIEVENVETDKYLDNGNEAQDKMEKMHQNHFTDLKSDEASMNEDSESDEEEGNDDDSEKYDFDRYKRHPAKSLQIDPHVEYKWFRNGKLLVNETNDFHIFPNGTLKIVYSDKVDGEYRCMADLIRWGIGAVLSKSCVVEKGGFTRIPAPTNITAELGTSLVLNCPYYSVPKANITWKVNNSDIDFNNNNNRYFQLQNGSLLIAKVKGIDDQRFRCIAKNMYSTIKNQRMYTPSVHVIPIRILDAREKSTLLPPLQNQTIKVNSGDQLKLHCAAVYDSVRWTFTPRYSITPIDIRDATNEIRFRNVSLMHDGTYNCSTVTEFQLYDVTVLVAPTIVQSLISNQPSQGAFVTFNCTATGNPKPTVTWYRNGQPIHYDYIISYNEPILKINTYEEYHKGIYQCVAKNEGGEAQAAALLSWTNKQYLPSPNIIKCYPVNQNSMLIEFDKKYNGHDILYYTADQNSSNKWSSSVEYNPIQVENKYLLNQIHRRPFEPFMLYVRVLEKTGIESVDGRDKIMYDLSRLSNGIKCALQGLELFSIVHMTNIFIWWPPINNLNTSHFTVQFRQNDTKFADQIIGTTHYIHSESVWDDIQPKLVKIAATTNIYPQSDINRHRRAFPLNSRRYISFHRNDNSQSMQPDGKSSEPPKVSIVRSEAITEVRVSGNVTGILIPNASQIIVRVIVPIHEDGSEDLDQDKNFMEWKTIPNFLLRYQIEVSARSVTLQVSDSHITCLKVCYHIRDRVCLNITSTDSEFVVKPLSANTDYKLLVYDCQSNDQIEAFEVHTKYDPPGPVTDLNITRDNIVALSWNPPSNGTTNISSLSYYLINWTIGNESNSANVSVNQHYFQIPSSTRNDKYNITIRAIGKYGIGIPVYYNMQQLRDVNPGDSSELQTESNDQLLGIGIGVSLSILCVIICAFIIIRLQFPPKPRARCTNMNDSSSPPTVRTAPAACTVDMHEMQTLISKPDHPFQLQPCLLAAMPNGVIVRPTGNNGTVGFNAVAIPNTDEPLAHDGLLVSSTPKKKHDLNTHPNSFIVNKSINDSPTSKLNHSTTVPDQVSINGNTIKNGIANLPLPQTIHSINDDSTVPDGGGITSALPSTKSYPSSPLVTAPIPKVNGNIKVSFTPQYLIDSHSPSLTFDSSHKQLLDSTIDSSKINLDTLDEHEIGSSGHDNDDNAHDDTIELNGGSNYSQKPLNNWNYRRPIVGPNG